MMSCELALVKIASREATETTPLKAAKAMMNCSAKAVTTF